MTFSRRGFIGGALAVTPGLLGLPGLGLPALGLPALGLPALGRSVLRTPGSRPYPHLAAGTDTLPGIDHIVLLMMENHSYDNIFGMLGRGDGFTLGADGQPTATNPYPDGSVQHAFHMPTTCQLPGTPSQEWLTSHTAYDNGKLDGFVRAPRSVVDSTIVGGVAMGYWTGDDLPFTYSLAKTFPIGDRWFCSLLGQTYPNRRFLIAGTSCGMVDDGGLSALTAVSPPAGTIFTLLDKYGISWENYVAQYPVGATPFLYPGVDATPESSRHKDLSSFFGNAAAGRLASFTFLDPNYDTQSQENPQNIVVGEALLARVVQAVGASPLWRKTMLIITYDEHGGYYDHVPPPAAIPPDTFKPLVFTGEPVYDGFARYGFRVPSVIVSPYAKRDHVTHVVHDHTSVLATLERKWNLPALTHRDANASDLTDFLDLDALRAQRPTFPRLPTLAAPGDTPAAMACSVHGPGTIPPPGSITLPRSTDLPHRCDPGREWPCT